MDARNDDDTESWWMSGCRDSLFFYRIYRGGRGQSDVRLGKIPGDMLEELILWGVGELSVVVVVAVASAVVV